MKPYRGLALAVAGVTLALLGIAILDFGVADRATTEVLWSGPGALGVIFPAIGSVLALVAVLLIRE